jgi:hypothetical protein
VEPRKEEEEEEDIYVDPLNPDGPPGSISRFGIPVQGTNVSRCQLHSLNVKAVL